MAKLSPRSEGHVGQAETEKEGFTLVKMIQRSEAGTLVKMNQKWEKDMFAKMSQTKGRGRAGHEESAEERVRRVRALVKMSHEWGKGACSDESEE